MALHVDQGARPFTYDDLAGFPEDGYRREIIGGSLIATPAPSGRHQLVVIHLGAILLAARSSDAVVLVAPYDWKLPDGGSVEPDVIVFGSEDFDPDGPLRESALPLLVVEVLSPSNPEQDRAVKRALYERRGVPAYWVVDPLSPALLALRLVGGRYEVEAEVARDEVFTTDWPFPVEVVPAELLQ